MKSPSPEVANERDAMDALHAAIMNLPCNPPERSSGELRVAYKLGHRDARHAAAELAAALASTAAKADAGNLVERLKLEAQMHAQEARTANATIAEIYQIVTGKSGEPGNWHGAEPVRKCIEELRAAIAASPKTNGGMGS
jgi:hypothetical protein